MSINGDTMDKCWRNAFEFWCKALLACAFFVFVLNYMVW